MPSSRSHTQSDTGTRTERRFTAGDRVLLTSVPSRLSFMAVLVGSRGSVVQVRERDGDLPDAVKVRGLLTDDLWMVEKYLELWTGSDEDDEESEDVA